jgi:hypothetical protein
MVDKRWRRFFESVRTLGARFSQKDSGGSDVLPPDRNAFPD